jgi:hypothetical protein
MVVVPTPIPVTTPVAAPTVAMVRFDDDHVPPVATSFSVVVEPRHTVAVPVIAGGAGFTVTG